MNQTHPQTSAPTNTALEIIHGMWRAMVVKTLVELSIPALLQSGPKSAEELAAATKTRPKALYRFLRAAAACQFLDVRSTAQERLFYATEQSRALCSDQPHSSLIQYLLAPFEIKTWSRLGETVRTEERAIDAVLGMSLWEYLEQHPADNDHFNGAMTALTAPVLLPLAQAYPDFAHLESVMDVGGGAGSLLLRILQTYPTIRGMLFDRAQVIEQARTNIARAGFQERCTCLAGSFFEAIPGGASAYILKNVLHDWDDQQVVHILKNVRHALSPDSRVLIAELIMSESAPSFAIAALDLHMLLETGGRQRTIPEFQHLLQEAGLAIERVIPVGRSPYNIIDARAI